MAPVVAQCVAALVDEITESADAGTAGPAMTRTAGSRVFQLKISLRDASPPIWRRVLVPSSITLAELHAVIQRCFAWDGSHLHAFHSERGRRVTSYAPAGLDLEESTDEATVALSEVLGGSGTRLTYTYDFGDSWEHLIELEQTLDDDGQELPACTGGKRAAPEEDSGGVWGWENLLETVNDPTNDAYEEMRDWMGLRPGEVLDRQAFDRESVNRRLAVLRG